MTDATPHPEQQYPPAPQRQYQPHPGAVPPHPGAVPPYPGAPAPQPSGAGALPQVGKGFFASLFDLRFRHFITRKIAGVLYLVTIILTVLGVVAGFFALLSAAFGLFDLAGSYYGGPGLGALAVVVLILAIVVPPVGGLFTLMLVRMGIELSVAAVVIAENTDPNRAPSAR